MTPSTSTDIALRAKRLLEKYPNELAKACYCAEAIGYTLTPGDLPKLRKVNEDGNPLLVPRVKPLHITAVTISKPKASHKAALGGSLEYVIDARAAVWDLLDENGKNGELFNALLSIEVTETKDGALRYGLFKAGPAYHEATIAKFGAFYDDIVDPREIPLLAPPTVEEMAAQRMSARPDALVVTSGEDD
jgi:hypothetical protein